MPNIALIEDSLPSPAMLSTAAVILLAWLLRLYNNRPRTIALPVAELEAGHLTDSLMKARAKYPDSPFVFPLSKPLVIMPYSLANEIVSFPDEDVSFKKHSYDRMHGRYTGIGKPFPETIEAIKLDLTKNITKVLSDLQDEMNYAFQREIGDCLEWTKVPVYRTVTQIIALSSGRVFVGLPLSRDKGWTDVTINFTRAIIAAVTAVEKYHPFIRPFVSPFLPELQKLRGCYDFAAAKLEPQVSAILASRQGQTNSNLQEDISEDDVFKGDFNMVHWILSRFKNIKDANATVLGRRQLIIAFAAIHSTSMALSHAIFDLAAYPEYAAELHAELKSVIEEENYPDKRLHKTSMSKLKKLDSFIKESLRIHPPSMISIHRKVTAAGGLHLSTGHVIPYNTSIGFGHPFYPSSTVPGVSALTSGSQPPLSVFAPFRYSNLRSSTPAEKNKHQFVTLGPDNIAFGNGVHACPGRFFASNQIKVALVEILRRYDVGLGPNGEGEGQGGYERPKMLERETFYYPDPMAEVWVRNRTEGAF